MNATIRPERPDDCAGIDEVNRLAFGQDHEARLVAALRRQRDFDPALSLLAIHSNKVVGHILFSPIQIVTEQGNVPAQALAPISVRPECQRRGVGSDLIRKGLDECNRLGHRIIIVVGHGAYYSRFGFVQARPLGLRCPFEVPDESFMVLPLIPPALNGVRGIVQYSTPFDEF